MLSNQHIQNLLYAINKLFSTIALKSLHHRIQKNQHRKHAHSAHDISKLLTKQVHHLANSYQQPAEKDDGENLIHKKNTISKKESVNHNTAPSSQNIIKPLSDHLKNKNIIDSTHTGIAEKLITSTWDHFHAAIREARNGNKTTALMHTDIANHAMKEAVHYLPKEEYKIFCLDVKREIDEINKPGG